MTPLKYLLVIASICIAVGLLFVRADRQVISLTPSTDSTLIIPLSAEETYEQRFITPARNISRVGLYVRPLVQDLPAETVTMELRRGGTVLYRQGIPSSFLRANSPLFLHIPTPEETRVAEQLTISVSVSSALSGKVGLMQREQDETFNNDAILFISGEAQFHPAAYEVLTAAQPVITLQVGGLILLGVALLFGLRRTRLATRLGLYSLLLPAIGLLPILITSPQRVITLFVIQVIILLVWLTVSRRTGLNPVASLFGAHIAAFTSFWALVLTANKYWVSWLPIHSIGDARNIFLDPNQLGVTSVGAYIGIPIALFALLGLLVLVRRDQRSIITAVALLLIGFVYAPVVGVIGVAYAGMIGFQSLSRFLHSYGRVASILLYAILYICLLDLWSVQSRIIDQIL